MIGKILLVVSLFVAALFVLLKNAKRLVGAFVIWFACVSERPALKGDGARKAGLYRNLLAIRIAFIMSGWESEEALEVGNFVVAMFLIEDDAAVWIGRYDHLRGHKGRQFVARFMGQDFPYEEFAAYHTSIKN